MMTKYERSLVRAGYHRGTGDLYNCWMKPKTTMWQRIQRLAPGVLVVIVGATGLLYISV